MEKYCRVGQATDDKVHAGYLRLQIHTLSLCNTYCFSTATMVARTRLNVIRTLLVLFVLSTIKKPENCGYMKADTTVTKVD